MYSNRSSKLSQEIEAYKIFFVSRTDIDVVRVLGSTFQIKAIEAVPCALWIVCTSHRDPEECLIRGVNMGGDTDTVAAMIGDIVGALHGQQWIPARWYDHIEPNSEANLGRGKAFAIELAKKLSVINLNSVMDDDN
jgi:ADP-ribosylglycohydrolase